MYNGIGLQTVRGSGTNGYVTRNFAILRKHEKVKTNDDFKDDPANRQPNKEILEHVRKRKIEVKCMEYAEKLEENGISDEEVERKVDELRKTLQLEAEKEITDKAELEKVEIVQETHHVAAANLQKNSLLRHAFGISEFFVEGSSFDPERREREAQMKEEARKRYELVRTPSPTPQDSTKCLVESLEKVIKSDKKTEGKKIKKKKDKDKKLEKSKRKKKKNKKEQPSSSSESDASESSVSSEDSTVEKVKKKKNKKDSESKKKNLKKKVKSKSPVKSKKKRKSEGKSKNSENIEKVKKEKNVKSDSSSTSDEDSDDVDCSVKKIVLKKDKKADIVNLESDGEYADDDSISDDEKNKSNVKRKRKISRTSERKKKLKLDEKIKEKETIPEIPAKPEEKDDNKDEWDIEALKLSSDNDDSCNFVDVWHLVDEKTVIKVKQIKKKNKDNRKDKN